MAMAVALNAETMLNRDANENSAMGIGAGSFDSRFSLLDPNRFSMNHSYSVSYFSYGGHGETIGLYMNSMRYSLSNSLSVDVTLGWVHQPSQVLWGDSRGTKDYGSILPNVRLLYQPSEKFHLLISYETVPGVYGGQGRYYRPYGTRPFNNVIW
jgi:hypothetical protein